MDCLPSEGFICVCIVVAVVIIFGAGVMVGGYLF